MNKELRILVVEDSESDALLLMQELHRGGFEPVFERVDTEAAMVSAITNQTWDIIISDYIMPHFSGLEALRVLQKSGRDLPFIIVSGKISEEIAVEAMKAGAHDYMSKNNLKRFVPAVERELGEAKMRRERKHLERELARAKEEKFRVIFDNAADGILIADMENKKFYMGNNSICRMLGYSSEEIEDLGVMDIHPEKDLPRVISQFERQAKGESHLAEDLPVKRKDGSVFYADVNATTITIAGETYLMGFFRDTTERKKMEVERGKTLEWQEDVVLLQQSLLASTSLDNKLKAITDSIVRIFGADFCRIWLIRPGDLCEKGCVHAEVKEGPHICRYRDKCLHLMASSGRYTHIDGKEHRRVPFGCYKIGRIASGEEHKFLTNDVLNDPRVHNHEWARELGLVSFAGYQIRIPNGEMIGVLALFAKHILLPVEDATLDSISTTAAFVIQQAAAEQEKERVRDIETVSETSSKFTSMVSHELRSPLGAIKEGINLVLEGLAGNINDEQRDLLDTAKKNTDRLTRLINNVLDFQKIEAGKMEFDIQENDINEAVSEVNKTMSLVAKEKGLDLVVNVDNSIPKLKFDKDKIVEVLTNLVSNAVKYAEKGNITISTKLEDNTVHVIVQDIGRGIRAEDMQKLFQAFGQLNGKRDKKKGGTGLGLAISKEIILAHKGKIWADSEANKGSSFHFVLPLKMRRKEDWSGEREPLGRPRG